MTTTDTQKKGKASMLVLTGCAVLVTGLVMTWVIDTSSGTASHISGFELLTQPEHADRFGLGFLIMLNIISTVFAILIAFSFLFWSRAGGLYFILVGTVVATVNAFVAYRIENFDFFTGSSIAPIFLGDGAYVTIAGGGIIILGGVERLISG